MFLLSVRLCEINWPKSPISIRYFERIRSLFLRPLFSGTYDFLFYFAVLLFKMRSLPYNGCHSQTHNTHATSLFSLSSTRCHCRCRIKPKIVKNLYAASKTSVCHFSCAVALSLYFIYFPISSPSTWLVSSVSLFFQFASLFFYRMIN